MKETDLSLFDKRINDVLDRKEIVEIYRDRIATEPLIGRIIRKSAHIFVVEKLDELYQFNGWAAARPSDITRMKWGGRELKAAKEIASEARQAPEFPEATLLEISSVLTVFAMTFGYVAAYLEGLSSNIVFIGALVELDDDFVHLRQFGTFKEMARSDLLLRLDEITRVDADGNYERQLQKVYDPKPHDDKPLARHLFDYFV